VNIFKLKGEKRCLKPLMVGLTFLIILLLGDSPGVKAHNGNPHVWIIRDALDYMYSCPYATITQNAAVQDLVTRYGSLDKVKQLLGDASKQTDGFHDMYFHTTAWTCKVGAFFGLAGGWTGGYDYEGHHFTTLNHSQNAGIDGVLWNPEDGYYYWWSSQSGDDSKSMKDEPIDWCDLKIDHALSPAMDRYRFHGFKGSDSQFNDNMDCEIHDTRFAPVASLANYWYRVYVASIISSSITSFMGGPISLLGPTLHAAADITIPQHSLGASGFRHQDYEDWIETVIYEGKVKRNDNRIFSYLNQERFFARGLGYVNNQYPIIQVYADMADYVRWYLSAYNPGSDIKSNQFWDNYWAGGDYDPKRLNETEDFYNLAIASTVRTLEAACMEINGGKGDVYVSLSTGSTFQGTGVKWSNHFCYGEEIPLTGDFNGDGKDDIVTFLRNTTQKDTDYGDVYVALSNGSGFGPGKKWRDNFCPGSELPAVGDFNGDGYDDIVTFVREYAPDDRKGEVLVALSNGSGFGPGQLWRKSFFTGTDVPLVGDFNGDGKDDIMTFGHQYLPVMGMPESSQMQFIAVVALSTGSGFGSSGIWCQAPWPSYGELQAVGDFNGDGRDDFALFVRDTRSGNERGKVYVAFSNGSGFDSLQNWHDYFCIGREVPAVGDFDGDGKDDIATFVRNTKTGSGAGDVYVALTYVSSIELPSMTESSLLPHIWPESFPSGKAATYSFGQSQIWHDSFCFKHQIPGLGDFDGNGKDDIIAFNR